MPMGTGASGYGKKKGRPPTKKLTEKQKKLPINLQKAILKKKKGKK